MIYQVTLLGSGVVTVNHTSCGEVCIVNFQNFSDATEVYRVSLFAVNAIGASELVEYPAIIGMSTLIMSKYIYYRVRQFNTYKSYEIIYSKAIIISYY